MIQKTPLLMIFSFLADFNFWFAFLRLQPRKNQPLATCQCYAEKILSGLVLIHKTRNSNSHIINDLSVSSTHHQHINNTAQHILVFWSVEILLLSCRCIQENITEITSLHNTYPYLQISLPSSMPLGKKCKDWNLIRILVIQLYNSLQSSTWKWNLIYLIPYFLFGLFSLA